VRSLCFGVCTCDYFFTQQRYLVKWNVGREKDRWGKSESKTSWYLRQHKVRDHFLSHSVIDIRTWRESFFSLLYLHSWSHPLRHHLESTHLQLLLYESVPSAARSVSVFVVCRSHTVLCVSTHVCCVSVSAPTHLQKTSHGPCLKPAGTPAELCLCFVFVCHY